MAAPDELLDRLYGLPLEAFTSARDEAAASLRKAGQREEADAVKRLAKPSITAWALNQVARRQPALVSRLLDAGAALASAQQALLAGRDRSGFRSATEAERRAIETLVEAAASVLQEGGHPPAKAALDRLEATLRAAAAGTDAGELLRRGVLTKDLDPSGFGFGFPGEALPAPIPFRVRPKKDEPAPAREQAGDERRRQELEQARDAVASLKQRLLALRDRAAEAEGEAAASRQSATDADQAVGAARQALARAEQAAAVAHKSEEENAQALAELRSSIDRTADDLAEAEAALRQARA